MTQPTILPALPTRISLGLRRLLQPGNLAGVVCRTPFIVNKQLIQLVLNHVLAEQIREGDFDFLQGKVFQIELRDAELFVGLGFEQGRFVCHYLQKRSQQAEVSLSLQTLHAIELIRQNIDPDTLFFQRKLKINGSTELAHQLKNTLDNLDIQKIPAWVLKLLQEYQQRIL